MKEQVRLPPPPPTFAFKLNFSSFGRQASDFDYGAFLVNKKAKSVRCSPSGHKRTFQPNQLHALQVNFTGLPE